MLMSLITSLLGRSKREQDGGWAEVGRSRGGPCIKEQNKEENIMEEVKFEKVEFVPQSEFRLMELKPETKMIKEAIEKLQPGEIIKMAVPAGIENPAKWVRLWHGRTKSAANKVEKMEFKITTRKGGLFILRVK